MSMYHDPTAATQNCGNFLGTRPSVRLLSHQYGNNLFSGSGSVAGFYGYGNASASKTKTNAESRAKDDNNEAQKVQTSTKEKSIAKFTAANTSEKLNQNQNQDVKSGAREALPVPENRMVVKSKASAKANRGQLASNSSIIGDSRVEDSRWRTSNASYGNFF